MRVKGKWAYLDRAVDSAGASIDFLANIFLPRGQAGFRFIM
ncbi:MAG: hypothetical protein LAQ69_23380 [Acidobacteriia bacterium]|nr:hypothetical protein [Terriglobia bacterium]